MTAVRLYKRQGKVIKAEMEGHSGFAESGEDIVCAAITSAVRMLETTLNDVLHAEAAVATDADRAFISVGPAARESECAKVLFSGFAAYMFELSREYPQYITIDNLEY